MALALRFAEEGEFSSRACDISLEAPDVAPSSAIFRWSKPVRSLLGEEPVHVDTLIVATPSAQRFVQELAAKWTPVGALVTTDQSIPPCRLQDATAAPAMGTLLSKTGEQVSAPGNHLALLLGQEVRVASTWIWLKTLFQHVDAREIVCLDSQLSTIYEDEFASAESGPQLRMLASSSVTDEMKLQTPVRPLEVPQFVAGIPAALLTHGELHKRPVRVFVSLRDVAAHPGDVMRSFLPLVESATSVLGMLERPLFYRPTEVNRAPGSLNVLYT